MKTTDHAHARHLNNKDQRERCACGSTAIEKDTHRCSACQTRHLANFPDAHLYYEILDEMNLGGVDKARVVLLERQLDEFEKRPNW